MKKSLLCKRDFEVLYICSAGPGSQKITPLQLVLILIFGMSQTQF